MKIFDPYKNLPFSARPFASKIGFIIGWTVGTIAQLVYLSIIPIFMISLIYIFFHFVIKYW